MNRANLPPAITLKKEHGNIETSLNYILKQSLPKNAYILDIGCRYGSLLYNLHRSGYEHLYGLDINRKAIEKGKEAYPEISSRLIWCDQPLIPFEAETFDAVLMFDVLEHLAGVESYLRENVRRVLKKDGWLLFQTPNKYTNILWEIAARRSLTGWRRYHRSLQTLSSLKAALHKSGFSEVTVEKQTLLSKFNLSKANSILGKRGTFFLKLWEHAPMIIYPHFWGKARKGPFNSLS